MAEANKCDVLNCGVFEDGSPAARFNFSGQSKGMCSKHATEVASNLFPDLLPKEEPVAEQPAETVEAQPEPQPQA